MDSEFALAATVCVINVSVCVRVSCVCVFASGRGGGAALLLPVRSDVGEQLPPPQGCEPRSAPARALRTDGWHACDGRSASRPSIRSARARPQAKIEHGGIRSVYALNFDTACSTARLGATGAT